MDSFHTSHIELGKLLILQLLVIIFINVFTISESLAKSLNIAVIETESSEQSLNIQNHIFKEEIASLFENSEFQLNYISYPTSDSQSTEEIHELFYSVSEDNNINIILVLDIAANQIIAVSETFKKPTFLPFVFNAELSGIPLKNNTSGKNNLNYITANFNFKKELESLRAVASFKNIVLITDSRIQNNLNPEHINEIIAQAKNANVNLIIRNFSDDIDEVISSFPEDTDAVLYGYITNASQNKVKSLINKVNSLGLISFSLAGEEYVKLGVFATNIPTTDLEKLARRTAIHIEEVLLGSKVSNLPIFFETSKRLVINMKTSRKIRVAPSFDVLSDAILINEFLEIDTQKYSLTEVARLAVRNNLSALAQRLQAMQAEESVKEVRGALLPQINSSIEYIKRRDSNSTRSGTVAENTTDGVLRFSQTIYSEDQWAAYSIEKYIALSEKELVKEVELDITQAAVNAYLNVLRDKTTLEQERYNLNITHENFKLAQSRVEIGTETASDLYRWESELANAKQAVLDAKANYEQQKKTLNQILNRPISENFAISDEKLDNPDLIISDKRITELIKNVYDLNALSDYFVEEGLKRAPEIKQIQADLLATKRQLKSDQRSYWVPDINLSSEYSNNFNEDLVTGGIASDENDWTIGIELSLPLYEGGARSARVSQGRLAIAQQEANLKNVRNQIEQNIRNNLESAHASYSSIPLAKKAEIAAQQNYELIADSYTQGAKGITDVLDAQETLIDAREASLNSVYTFLIDLMNVQREMGAFDFFLTDTQRIDFLNQLIDRVNTP